MNGVEHYTQAEELLRIAAKLGDIHPSVPVVTATAQVHATLALAAATALTSTHHYVGDSREITAWAHAIQPDAMATKPCPDGCRDIHGDGCLPRCVDTRAAQPAPIDEEPPF
ncbi:MAG: hypothetical protein HOV94_34570 [Saccharothrix sp.]|nr:hypothetical protein [Saccharothrix sp.]